MLRLDRASGQANLSTGRLGNQFANLAGRIAHVHPVVGNLASVLGDFAVGGAVTVGVLGGLAAVAVAYDRLTASSRKSMEIADKLAESYNRAARIAALGFGGKQLADIEDINRGLEQHHKWLGFIIAARTQLGALGGLFGNDPGGHAKAITEDAKGRARAEQERINEIGLANAKSNEAWAKRIKDQNDKLAADAKKAQQNFLAGISSGIAVFDNLASHGTASGVVNAKLISDYERITAQIREMGHASTPAALELLKLRDALAANLVVAQAIARANSTGTVGPLVGKALPGVGFTPSGAMPTEPMRRVGSPSDPILEVGDQVQMQLQKDAEKAAQHAQMIQSAIMMSAQIVGNVVSQALNVGGGGRGSGIGGALGSGLGSAFGASISQLGWAGGPLGGIIGGLAGSFLGGLFDSNKKAVNQNTLATRENTAVMAMMLNAPGGFRVNSYRYGSSATSPDIDAIATAQRRRQSRGGTGGRL